MTSALEQAKSALESVQDDPTVSGEIAGRLLSNPAIGDDAKLYARWALGRSHHELDEVALAVEELEGALADGLKSDLVDLAAEVRVSLSLCLFSAGRVDDAFAQLDLAELVLDGAPWARAVMQRALLEHRQGNQHVALDLFDDALPALVEGGDRLAEARLLANRSALHTYLGHWADAQSDLDRLLPLARDLGQRLMEAVTYQNLAFLHGRRGQLPRALQAFALARASFEHAGSPARLVASLDIDEAELLMTAGLFDEAATVASTAASRNSQSGNSIGEGDARLLLSRALLNSGQLEQSAAQAGLALRILEADQRTAFAALARFVQLLALLRTHSPSTPPPSVDLFHDAKSLADVLHTQGWESESLEIRAEVGQALLESGDVQSCIQMLSMAPDLRHSGSVLSQLTSWRVEGVRRFAKGDLPSAGRALAAGLRVLESHRATLGATEFRAHASAHGAALASLGADLELSRKHPRGVLLWSERFRATALIAEITPEQDLSEAPDELATLRQLQATLTDTINEGGDTALVSRDLRRAERRFTARKRRQASKSAAPPQLTHALIEGLLAMMGDRVLVEFLNAGSDLWGVVAQRNRVRLIQIGALDELGALIDRLNFAMGRGIRGRGHGAEGGRAAEQLLIQSTGHLDSFLFGPLRLPVGQHEIVLSPAGRLHELPWGILPTLADRAFTVTPSLRLWGRIGKPAPPERQLGRVGIVAGPGLPSAQTEAQLLSKLHPDSELLDNEAATPTNVLHLLARTDLAHLAAHGTFREESPLFSEIHLHDGSVTVHDLESLPTVPHTIVLPACDAGRHQTRVAGELIGTVGSLLSIGVESVVAPVRPIADAVTTSHMEQVHRGLLRGQDAAGALAMLRKNTVAKPLIERVTAGSFVAFGTRYH